MINKEIKKEIENFPLELRDLALDLLDEIGRKKKVRSELERFILDELGEIISEEEKNDFEGA